MAAFEFGITNASRRASPSSGPIRAQAMEPFMEPLTATTR